MRILIVEDNKKLAGSIKRGLEKEGYAVDFLMDGNEGFRRVVQCKDDYDLIILDLMLPGKDGMAICQEVRQRNIKIPILILTAKDATGDKIQGLNAGADDYLVKPFSFDELVARIKALLRRPKEVLPSEINVRDLILNTMTRKVFRGKREILLTLKEFALLEYLMRNPGQVFTREQLLDHAWDYSFDSFSNVVDVHMKNLRKKIDDNQNEKLLETIRGVGYRIKG